MILQELLIHQIYFLDTRVGFQISSYLVGHLGFLNPELDEGMAASEVTSPTDMHDEMKDEDLKATVALDKLIMGVSPKSSGPISAGDDHVPSTTYVTIHLPDGTQGSTLSQQKLQELIMHLSQSGQIQLREDSKIVIDVSYPTTSYC
ncbi:unnamed protein product [Schistosoma turkestanicum]|nr:unnamed protein product [Schistosoma turkestanicum]